MSDTPIARLREDHYRLGPTAGDGGFCALCNDEWPCDTIAALDALEAEAKDAELTVLKVAADLWARIDAAEVLIRGAQMDEHMNHGASLKRAALRTCEHPNCAPYREWLAGAEGEGR